MLDRVVSVQQYSDSRGMALITTAGSTPSSTLTTAMIPRHKRNWLDVRDFSSETLTGAIQCSRKGQPDKKHDTTTAGLLRQKQNWLVMRGFSSETLRLERHSAHH